MSTIGNEAVSKNDGADIGVRRRINFREGANITLTIADDPANHEIDVTIAAAGAAGTAWVDQFFPAENPNSNKGTYASFIMPDDDVITVRQTFLIPSDIVTIDTAVVILIPNATGNLYWSVATTFGQVCVGEQYDTHPDSIALNATGVTADEIECIDISAALTVATGGDLVGMEFVRDSVDALDTIVGDVHYIGILIQGSV